jgi:uncharacterized protein (DUF1697 family)
MARYVAFLRGVTPLNAKMPELRQCFEAAGFSDVRTVLSSGNVIFGARSAAEATLERRAEEAMASALGSAFPTVVRSVHWLEELLASDPYAEFDLSPVAKRVVTFLKRPTEPKTALPVEREGARILKVSGREVFTAYLPSPKGPVFMSLIERTFGTEVTTRTWESVEKCASA